MAKKDGAESPRSNTDEYVLPIVSFSIKKSMQHFPGNLNSCAMNTTLRRGKVRSTQAA